MTFSPKNLLIVGAGFSVNAGLPLATDFTRQLLNVDNLRVTGPSMRQIRLLRNFVDEVFGEGFEREVDQWPELEDIFTIIDMAANTGHHLGLHSSAARLRIVRRAILVRMIRMLSQAYGRKQADPDDSWRALESLFDNFDVENNAVLSMNWDTCFEQGVARTQKIRNVDYGCHAKSARFVEGELRHRRLSGRTLRIIKVHGSVNWLYCDACRNKFWVPPNETEKVAQTVFKRTDWRSFLTLPQMKSITTLSPMCLHCTAEGLGTRFATFSYRKALDFPMYASSWRTAEQYLKDSTNWIFFGYSMPNADFEFKHLLKRVQLTELIRPKITLITGGSVDSVNSTVARFSKFFGDVEGERFVFRNGLCGKAQGHLNSIGVTGKL